GRAPEGLPDPDPTRFLRTRSRARGGAAPPTPFRPGRAGGRGPGPPRSRGRTACKAPGIRPRAENRSARGPSRERSRSPPGEKRRDDEVEPGQVERFDRVQKEGKVLPVVPPRKGKPVQPRRVDRVGLDGSRDRARDVEEGENGGLGQVRKDLLENLLAAPHAVQPVVDDGGPHRPPRASASPYTSRVLSA